ncbi:MAG: ABC transporter ATP-binding protein [Nocardioidaceae bacterium]
MTTDRLRVHDLTLAYDHRPVINELEISIPDDSLTVIIGANGCGKSTLLRGLARMLAPKTGSVLLDGQDIRRLPSKQVARRLGLLPQGPIAPDGITVADLVGRGRYPHQGLLRQWSVDDESAVREAMAATSISAYADRLVDELSGGQRQRVWLALALAQQTPIMLLDEPTTFLDIAHQIDILDLCADLRYDHGRTLAVVLHDLNHACRYATHLVVMSEGQILAEGHPSQVITPELVEAAFGLSCSIVDDPETGTPLVIPRARPRNSRTTRQTPTLALQ